MHKLKLLVHPRKPVLQAPRVQTRVLCLQQLPALLPACQPTAFLAMELTQAAIVPEA
jgi:hypothetical protein